MKPLFDPPRLDELSEIIETMRGAKAVGLDLETTALSPRDGQIRLIQVATEDESFVLDLWTAELEFDMWQEFKALLEDGPLKIIQNAKFDMQFLKGQFDIDVWPVFDTMLASQILRNPENNLEWQVRHYLEMELPKEEQKSDWSKPLRPEQVEYARRDAEVLIPLARELKRELRQTKQTKIANIEFAALPAVVEMELTGVKIDQEKLVELTRKTKRERMEAHAEFESHMDTNKPQQLALDPNDPPVPRVNLRSPQQVRKIFAEANIHLPNTKEATLKTVKHPLAQALLKHRKRSKWLSSFLEPWQSGMVHPKTGRIHASFKQCTVITGRFACADPNLQQVPVRDTDEFRKLFVAEPGNVLITADYSGQEMRVLAELTREEVLLDALHQDPETDAGDIHKIAASFIFDKPTSEITKPERSRAKTLQFGLVYGRGAKAFAVDLGLDEDEAWEMIDTYFANYPKVKSWMFRQRARAETDGEVRSILGRKIPLNMSDESKSWKREAINYPIQGSSADMMKIALAKIMQTKPDYSDDARIVNCVHDEVVIECPEEDAKTLAKAVKSCMIQAGGEVLSEVPVEVEVHIAKEWTK